MAGITHEVKTEILAKVKAGEKVADLSKQYGISEQSIYSWLKQIFGVLTLELEKTKKIVVMCLPSISGRNGCGGS